METVSQIISKVRRVYIASGLESDARMSDVEQLLKPRHAGNNNASFSATCILILQRPSARPSVRRSRHSVLHQSRTCPLGKHSNAGLRTQTMARGASPEFSTGDRRSLQTVPHSDIISKQESILLESRGRLASSR